MAREKAADKARRLSPRKARICTECQQRYFGDLSWDCPRHPGKAIDQPDQPYFGQMPKLVDDREQKPDEPDS